MVQGESLSSEQGWHLFLCLSNFILLLVTQGQLDPLFGSWFNCYVIRACSVKTLLLVSYPDPSRCKREIRWVGPRFTLAQVKGNTLAH